MEKDELLNEEKIKDPVEKIDAVETPAADEADTGTAENSEEQTVEVNPGEENNVFETATEENTAEEPVTNENAAESPAAEEPVTEENVAEEPVTEEKMLTQSQVNELVGKARAEGRAAALKELYGRYGVNDDAEMNDIFGRGQGYDLLNDEYKSLNSKYGDLSAENALLKSGVVNSRWEDVKAILGRKGLDITAENIASEAQTHPEWLNNVPVANTATKEFSPEMGEQLAQNLKPKNEPVEEVSVRKLGSNIPETKVDSEENDVLKMFGL